MKRSLILPAAIALALHALLLFGFVPTNGPAATHPTRPHGEPPVVFITPIEEPDPELASSGGGSGSPHAAPPMLPDMPSTTPNAAIVIPISEPPRHVANESATMVMGSFSFGPGDGVGKIGPGGPVIDGRLLDNPPRTRVQPAPVYPYEMKRNGLGGQVWVEFTVDETGRVLNPRVTSSTARELEEPTLRAVEKWRFEPGKRDGRPVRFRMSVPVAFNVTPD